MNKKENYVFYLLAAILILLLTASVLGLIFLHPVSEPTITDVSVAIDFASFENGAAYEDFVALAEEMDFDKNPIGHMFLERLAGSVGREPLNYRCPEYYLEKMLVNWNEAAIRECEVVCLRFRYGGEEKELFCLYDYESYEEYIVRDGKLYTTSVLAGQNGVGEIVDRPEYDRLLKRTDYASYHGDSYEVGTFRYRRRFFTERHPETAIFSDFDNKTKVEIESNDQVLELALAELDYPYASVSGLYYDKLTGYYLVKLVKNKDPRTLPGEPPIYMYLTLGRGSYVIMDGNGVTKEIVPNNGAYWYDYMKYKN